MKLSSLQFVNRSELWRAYLWEYTRSSLLRAKSLLNSHNNMYVLISSCISRKSYAALKSKNTGILEEVILQWQSLLHLNPSCLFFEYLAYHYLSSASWLQPRNTHFHTHLPWNKLTTNFTDKKPALNQIEEVDTQLYFILRISWAS